MTTIIFQDNKGSSPQYVPQDKDCFPTMLLSGKKIFGNYYKKEIYDYNEKGLLKFEVKISPHNKKIYYIFLTQKGQEFIFLYKKAIILLRPFLFKKIIIDKYYRCFNVRFTSLNLEKKLVRFNVKKYFSTTKFKLKERFGDDLKDTSKYDIENKFELKIE